MGETDVAFRRLLRELPAPILHLVFPRRTFQVLGPLDASADRARQLTTDNLFRVRESGRSAVLHVEIEQRWRKTLPVRLLDYASSIHVTTQLPVISVALLLRNGGRPQTTYRMHGIGAGGLVFRYHVVPLFSLDATKMRVRLPPDAWPFLVAMKGCDGRFVRELVTELRVRRDLSGYRREATMGLLYIVSAAILGAGAARRIFHMEGIMRSSGVRALIRGWEAKGMAKGEARGMAKGEIKGRKDALVRLLEARFGSVGPDVMTQIGATHDAAQLDEWLVAVGTALSRADLFKVFRR